MTRQGIIVALLTGAAVYDGADAKQMVDKAEEIADEVLRRRGYTARCHCSY